MPDQLQLFGFKDLKPRAKVPISEARVREVQAMIEKGYGKGAAQAMRDLRYGLENYCKRIKNG